MSPQSSVLSRYKDIKDSYRMYISKLSNNMIAVAEATIILCTFEGNGNGLNVNCHSDIDRLSTGSKRTPVT